MGRVCLIIEESLKNQHFIDVQIPIHPESCQNNNCFADMQNEKYHIWLNLKTVK
jgi:hypothetical protein